MADKWEQLEQLLAGVFGHAKARADGHELALQKQLDGERLVVAVYVDSYIKGEWMVAEKGEPVHVEGRFWRPIRSRVWPLSKYKVLKRAFGKKKADEMTAQCIVSFSPYWASPRSLVRHLKKNFPDLELVGSEGEP